MNPRTGGVIQRRAPKRLHLACRRKRVERQLHGALAGSKRKRQGRARPRPTVGEEGKDRRMLLFDGRCQHDDLVGAARCQHKPSRRRPHAGQHPKYRAKPPGYDPLAEESQR